MTNGSFEDNASFLASPLEIRRFKYFSHIC